MDKGAKDIPLEVSKSSTPTIVTARFSISTITNINTVDESFQCSYFYSYRWRDPEITDHAILKKLGMKKVRNAIAFIQQARLSDYVKRLVDDKEIHETTDFDEIEGDKVWNPKYLSLCCNWIVSYYKMQPPSKRLLTMEPNWMSLGKKKMENLFRRSRRKLGIIFMLQGVMQRQQATFYQRMPLNMFPFDKQTLNILLYCTRPVSEVSHWKRLKLRWKLFMMNEEV